MDDRTLQEIRWWVDMLSTQRADKGISYRALSEITKIPVSTLHKIFHYNKDDVKVWQLMEVAKALGVYRISLNVPYRTPDG